MSNSVKYFLVRQAKRVIFGATIGCLLSMAVHLLIRDSKFLPSFRNGWLKAQNRFDGVNAYQKEFLTLGCVLLIALALFSVTRLTRFARAWRAGITSLTVVTTAFSCLFLLQLSVWSVWRVGAPIALISIVIGVELALLNRSEQRQHRGSIHILNVPKHTNAKPRAKLSAQLRSDDPIEDWSEDLIGRSAVVEMLAKYALAQSTPVVALHGALGDGKTSVLNLLRHTLEGKAVVVSFSTWLPGDEASLVIDLFRDIATECRTHLYVPQLRKHALAYARTMSGSFSYLAGLKELLPAESQRQEIEDLKQSVARVPLPIVVLLDELDRMNREELKVLLKMLRGAATIPNTTFICAFSEEEIRRKLLNDGELTQEYLEKFFPVTVRLAAPESSMIGRLFKTKVTNRFRQEPSWFGGTADKKKFDDRLDRLWDDCMSQVCTNLRKETLLSNDISSTATLIEREVDPLDLVAIECLRRFYPKVYDLVRRKPGLLVYDGGSFKDRYFMRDDKKTEDSTKFFQELATTINTYPEPDAAKGLLSYMFPLYSQAAKSLALSYLRQTTRDDAGAEKRICDPDYFAIYFRAGVPEELFSNLEHERVLSALNAAKSEAKTVSVISQLLKDNPKGHPRRDDALWKMSRSVDRLSDDAAIRLAFAIATHALEYTYGELNLGEAARALNIVFAVAQKLAASSEVQRVLTEAIARSSDDTFALRLLEFTENPDRNKILTNLKNVDVESVRARFMERMRSRYGVDVPIEKILIQQGDWRAFQRWVKNSPEDMAIEQDFWRRYIGQSRKRLAQAINFLYPSGYTWSEDPRPMISELLPVEEMGRLIENLHGDQLDETEENGIVRLRELLQGRWYDITRRMASKQDNASSAAVDSAH